MDNGFFAQCSDACDQVKCDMTACGFDTSVEMGRKGTKNLSPTPR